MSDDQKKIIEVKNLCKIFGNHPKKAIPLLQQGMKRDEIKARTGQVVGLHDLTFDIYEGEIFVLMGLSGSGKSTLLRCFNRLIEPTSGSISINGVDITQLSQAELRELRKTVISMVFQRFALFPHRTIIENVEYGLEINGISKTERKKAARAALETVKLKEWANAYPHQISGGMQQRVGLARALVLNPKIILMDEAFSALDPLIRAEM
jgi:glycine betaine/proline transport system ATP-binding protein